MLVREHHREADQDDDYETDSEILSVAKRTVEEDLALIKAGTRRRTFYDEALSRSKFKLVRGSSPQAPLRPHCLLREEACQLSWACECPRSSGVFNPFGRRLSM